MTDILAAQAKVRVPRPAERKLRPAEQEEPDDGEIDRIHEEGAAVAEHAWGPAGVNGGRNPYPPTSMRAEIWDYAFRNAYARSCGY